MKFIKTIAEMSAYSARAKKDGKKIGLVPTMGYLHSGHLSLVKEAKSRCDLAVVSIFVNPLQFGKNEDLEKYPRDMARDLEALKHCKVAAVFAPEPAEMYPDGYCTSVYVSGGLSEVFEGEIRQGHFNGVATVVTKLFNIIRPAVAFFGQKDAQQCVVIKRIASDLNMPLEIEIMPTVRESDGLAMSSRNTYLSAEDRKNAPVLFQALQFGQHMIELGEKRSKIIIREIEAKIDGVKHKGIDYVSVVNPDTLEAVATVAGKVLIILAVRFGTTRLLDNIIVD
ncbi:MAG: pantoate--beta-alanine ligase [Candidatus Firestonebacteria bacterium]